MNKRLVLLLLSVLLPHALSAQYIRRVESESMYKQLRSMETGPWEFSPEGWYYSWYKKKIKFLWWSKTITLPGAGVHDRGVAGTGILGDRYVRKYKPNAQVRAQMLALAEISRKQYEAVAEKHKDVGERELVDATDRKIDLSLRVYESKINTLKDNIRSLCVALRSQGYTQLELELSYLSKLQRIEENIKTISKSYIKNAERSSAYIREVKALTKLKNKAHKNLRRKYIEERYKEEIKL